ncbi:MaoC family dehydratase [Mycobacterium sp. CBMA293]|uniref:MaoC family dehydratase n=1 Tax=unclassified Mycolicibacterium TaxID=2636767 RepID=UPI0012DFE81C|nr:MULTISPECIES: MaoC family dehydratase [unclassified Mycolicibacterium]MUL49787.1 MaoC family dehydratase [Mycolicibacterium sp. CBMA 360]MUL58549.1 MaoC family dehydratase [Mycolicibacterium sp. CBMA 335]MUL74007.1 MaoC family dehydratase [Mycolicibacterium sp. CBMA 311]MUL93432.1 MaoC family dehydratase [Mycolicibacterium sp. CBMA 230]MUM04647.1 dehydratase [Mycolicibacterium sp. CBMA 213]
MTTSLATPNELLSLAGEQLGVSNWIEITQDQVNMFAEATGDQQWIHVDPVRAKAGPFGTTIVHGYLTLALAPVFMAEVLEIHDYAAVLNYGVNKVRFPAPLPVGSPVRAAITLLAAQERHPGNIEATFEIRYESRNSDRPPCVAETVYLYR